MHKRTILLCFCAVLVSYLSINASAHPGRTDSDGGHHDGDDYHYHHGYPAHDHLDMDGDGDLDCPYDFDDKTGQNSGSSSSGASSGVTLPVTNQEKCSFDPDKLMDEVSPYLAACIGIPMILAMIASFFNKELASICAFIASIIFFLATIFYGLLSIIGLFL